LPRPGRMTTALRAVTLEEEDASASEASASGAAEERRATLGLLLLSTTRPPARARPGEALRALTLESSRGATEEWEATLLFVPLVGLLTTRPPPVRPVARCVTAEAAAWFIGKMNGWHSFFVLVFLILHHLR
jgi:hypothetical protein